MDVTGCEPGRTGPKLSASSLPEPRWPEPGPEPCSTRDPVRTADGRTDGSGEDPASAHPAVFMGGGCGDGGWVGMGETDASQVEIKLFSFTPTQKKDGSDTTSERSR